MEIESLSLLYVNMWYIKRHFTFREILFPFPFSSFTFPNWLSLYLLSRTVKVPASKLIRWWLVFGRIRVWIQRTLELLTEETLACCIPVSWKLSAWSCQLLPCERSFHVSLFSSSVTTYKFLSEREHPTGVNASLAYLPGKTILELTFKVT